MILCAFVSLWQELYRPTHVLPQRNIPLRKLCAPGPCGKKRILLNRCTTCFSFRDAHWENFSKLLLKANLKNTTMTVSDNLDVFCGKSVDDYDRNTGIVNPQGRAYRIRITYDEYEQGTKSEDLITAFVNDPKAGEVTDLIIGAYDYESSTDSVGIVTAIVNAKDKLRNLKNLFIGDITYEESEISWIQQSDVSPVFAAYPGLVHFQVRGGTGLRLSALKHDTLETLIIETGGMYPETLKDVCNANLPNLRSLELWLGSEHYGFESKTEDLAPILSGKLFPKLKRLALRDSEISDDIAKALTGAPVMEQIEELDLSMGTLGDAGAQALIDNPAVRKLKNLNIDHHYLSNAMMEKMRQIGIPVEMDDQNEEDEGERYVEVAE
ncbi:MAG: wgr domain-containing protein [Bacteroidetes bacterium]|nr:MAG: wgr domain-containing protein [Bacteroidota bacterium]